MEDIQRSQGMMLSELLKVTRGHHYSEAEVAEFEQLMIAMNLRRQNLVSQVDASGVRRLFRNPDSVDDLPQSVSMFEVTGFESNYLIYEGPQLLQEEDLKEPFQPNNGCSGWCNNSEQRKIAANLILD